MLSAKLSHLLSLPSKAMLVASTVAGRTVPEHVVPALEKATVLICNAMLRVRPVEEKQSKIVQHLPEEFSSFRFEC